MVVIKWKLSWWPPMCQVQRLMLSFRDRLVIDDVGKVSWFPEFLMEVPPPRNIRILRSWIDTRFNVTQATFTDMNCEQGYWIQLKTQSNITNFDVTQNWFIVMVLALAEAKTYSHMSFTSGWSTPSPAPLVTVSQQSSLFQSIAQHTNLHIFGSWKFIGL